jgi:hypothetical protein
MVGEDFQCLAVLGDDTPTSVTDTFPDLSGNDPQLATR